MQRLAIALATASALLAAPALQAHDRMSGEEKLAKILDGRVAGEPVDCINTQSTRGARIIDKTAIVYDQGRTIYVNRPVHASNLDDGDVMVTRLHTNRLCSIDVVRLHDSSLHLPTGFVGLEKFVPYRRVAKAQ